MDRVRRREGAQISKLKCAWRGVNLNRFIKKRLFIKLAFIAANIFFFFFLFGSTHRLMYKKFLSFVYIFVIICRFYPNNSRYVKVCPIKLKIVMLCQKSNTCSQVDLRPKKVCKWVFLL